ncbi:LysR family transcriptional regulator [soil metagenome]
MDLDALRIFVRVAELESFTQAADDLGMAKGRVSTIVQQLETQLGTRLLNRTTRKVRMTQDGAALAERARLLLGDVDDLQSMFEQSPTSLSGRLRVDMPTAVARHSVIPALPAFLAEHPLLEIEISTTDRFVDVVREGFDCVVRIGALADSSLVARPLGSLRQVNVASADYVAAHGTPRTLADLDRHRLVHYASTFGTPPIGFEYLAGGRRQTLAMKGAVTVNNADAYLTSCLAGLGIIQIPASAVHAQLADGRLVEILPDETAPPMPMTVLYPHRRNLSKRLQAFIAWLAGVLQPYLESSHASAAHDSQLRAKVATRSASTR